MSGDEGGDLPVKKKAKGGAFKERSTSPGSSSNSSTKATRGTTIGDVDRSDRLKGKKKREKRERDDSQQRESEEVKRARLTAGESAIAEMQDFGRK
jgi:hypothetical protein